jgi:hypothetical protein
VPKPACRFAIDYGWNSHAWAWALRRDGAFLERGRWSLRPNAVRLAPVNDSVGDVLFGVLGVVLVIGLALLLSLPVALGLGYWAHILWDVARYSWGLV